MGQADLGTTFTKCYVKDVNITAGQNSAGFVGVDYAMEGDAVPGGGIFQCYVDGGSITASAANVGGFAGYPEKATIKNCYTTMDVNGVTFAAIGGFIGICKATTTIQHPIPPVISPEREATSVRLWVMWMVTPPHTSTPA